jgi:hypothetical protein
MLIKNIIVIQETIIEMIINTGQILNVWIVDIDGMRKAANEYF